MLLALTIGVLLVGWAVLLSPPFESIRVALGLELPPYGRAVTLDGGRAAEICNTDQEACKEYLARITLLYHGVFAILIAMAVFPATTLYDFNPEYRKPVLALTNLGYLMTVAGGILYGYWVEDPFLHGVFIAGLAFLFAAGVLFLLGLRVRREGGIDLLALNLQLAALLLLLTAIIGGWLGANEMAHIGEVLREAKMLARIDPDLAEEVLAWRAMTAHQHGMVAILGAAVAMLAFKQFGIQRERRLIRVSLVLALAGQLVMVTASWAVWPLGKIAHLAITPAALLLIFAVALIAVAELKRRAMELGVGALLTSHIKYPAVYLLLIWVWPTVAVPGAIVATSLRQPRFLQPEFRNPVWDWAENAYNIGHWHILIFLYGAALFILYLDLFSRGRIGHLAMGLAAISTLVASLAVNFYMVPANPGRYVPNPYNDVVLTFLVEPALALFALAVAVGYLYMLYSYLGEKVR
jgi:hypothetical protein